MNTRAATTSTRTALILAAGYGSRIAVRSGDLPKPLVPLNGTPLLAHVMNGAREAGIGKFVIVVGHKSAMIREWYIRQPLRDVEVTWIENPAYRKDNGISVLCARPAIDENFLLLMADHMFEAKTARSLLRQRIGRDEVILAVDRNIGRVFDLDDATKVRIERDRIIDIGKTLADYDALDTGMFLCTPALFRYLDQAAVGGNCSLSDGVGLAARNRAFRAFDIGDSWWLDIDTPAAHDHAREIFTRGHLEAIPPRSVAYA